MDIPFSSRLRRLLAGTVSLCLSLAGVSALAAGGGGSGAAQVPLGGNAAIDYAYRYSGGAYTDVTAAANSTTANDVTIGSNTVNDVLYVGMKSPFDTIYLDVGTWGVGAAGTLKYEYVSGILLNANLYKTLSVSSGSGDANLKTAVSGGMTTLSFAPPSDWLATGKVNGTTAYWLKITTTGGYTTAVKANQLKVKAYNVRLNVAESYSDAPWTANITPTLSACGSAIYLGEWNAGNGVHYYALRTDGGSCGLEFDAPNYLATGIITFNNLTTTLTAQGGAFRLGQNLVVEVYDDVGNALADATVVWNGMQILESTVSDIGYYFTSQMSGVAGVLTITRTGYVTEDAQSGANTALQSVTPSESTLFIDLYYNGVGNIPAPCTSVLQGIAHCQPLRRDTQLTVFGGGAPVAGASVTWYMDAGMQQLADDIAKQGQASDAAGITDTAGVAKAALATGNYTYTVSAPGYTPFTGTAAVTSGVLNSFTATLTSGANPQMNDQTISAVQSSVLLSPNSVAADGTSAAIMTVTVRNASGQPLAGKSVTLAGVLSGLTVTPASVMTDANGVATLALRSTTEGTITIAAFADSTVLTQTATVQFTNTLVPDPQESEGEVLDPSLPPPAVVEDSAVSCQPSISSGTLVKLPDDGDPSTQSDTAVYYIGTDCKRHAFPNSKVYFSWYTDFANVTVVSPSTMASFGLGKAVNYRPAVKMVKFQSLSTVYVVAKGGVLRWVKSEAAANGLYGADWNKQVDDVSDAFFTNYTFGTDVNATGDFVAATELAAAPNISANF